MRKIVYYVASSLDGFISGPDEDISAFVGAGSGVDRYLADLNRFDTVIMGRSTYEFGYKFGLKPGQRAYKHMSHYIFSSTLRFAECDERVFVVPVNLAEINKIRHQPGKDIYLCGGGQLAGWLLDHDQIDILVVKLNPLILGKGVRIFGNSKKTLKLQLLDTEKFDHGLQIITYKLT